MVKVKTSFGDFNVLGYESNEIHYPIEFKPKKGFVYTESGAISDTDVLNWKDLPNVVILPKSLLEQRGRSDSFKKVAYL